MGKNNGRIRLAGAALLLGLVLLGCGKAPTDTIQLSCSVWGAPESVQAQAKFAKDFERLNPGIRVEVEPLAGDMTVASLMRLAGGSAADVMYVGNWCLFDFADKQAFLPLDDRLARDGIDLNQFYASALTGVQWKGHVYALPESINVESIYYNKDLFDRFRVPYPKSDWTWDDFLTTAQQLTKDVDHDGRTDIWGCYLWQWIPGFLPLMLQNDANMFDAGGTHFVMDDPRAIEALQFLKDLTSKYKVAPGRQALQSQLSIDMFTAGQMGMGGFGYWAVYELNNKAKFRWDAVDLPRRRKTGNVVHVHSYAISRESKHPEEAWKLVKYLTLGTPSAEANYLIPARKAVAQARLIPNAPAMPDHPDVFLRAIEDPNTVSPPFGPKYAEYNSILMLELDGIWLDKISVEAAMSKAKPEIEYIVNN